MSIRMEAADTGSRPPVFSTELSSSTKFKGKLSFSESLCVKGKFEGNISGGGFLLIDQSADVVSSVVEAEFISISGRFSGSAKASKSIELLPKSAVNASLSSRSLRIDGAAKFSGELEMPGLPPDWIHEESDANGALAPEIQPNTDN